MSEAPLKTVLVLGAGFCAPPLVRYLSEKGYNMIVASRTLARAEGIIADLPNAKAVAFDIESEDADAQLDTLTQEADLVISMLPYVFHVQAAKIAIKHKRHFATTSYVSPQMRELNDEAQAAGVVLLNECGVDPGSDHASAMRIIHNVQAKGGRVVSFTSYCGGLPAPEDNNNPMGYKLSWAPRGVLLAGRNTAVFLKDGAEVTIPGEDLFDNYSVMEVPGLGEFEAYPNRNSVHYVDVYGLEGAETVVRGTLRNKGWCKSIKTMVDLGWMSLDQDPTVPGVSYASLSAKLIGADDPALSGDALAAATAAHVGLEPDHDTIARMTWLGLFDADTTVPADRDTLLDALCFLCEQKMQYADGERDAIVMIHRFIVENADGSRSEIISSLFNTGLQHQGGASAMSRTVSFPVAIASRLILEGVFTKTGVQTPIIPELYNPILDELEQLGIVFQEQTTTLE